VTDRLPAPRRAADPGAVVYDLVGIGVGPFNLALAALADRVEPLRTLFLDRASAFSWHPGLLLDGTTLQVPFLADLVTLVDPTSPWSFLAYLRAHDRLFPFYFAERFHVPRREYDHYCRWVAESLPSVRFAGDVGSVEWVGDLYRIEFRDTGTGERHRVHARHVVLGIGTEPVVPAPFARLLGDTVLHAGGYLDHRENLTAAEDVTVLGSGQSGAEVFLDLLRRRTGPGQRLTWLTRSPAFAPMEYSKLGLEHFTPDYTRYFHALPEPVRDRLVPAQWQLYKAISAETIAAIHDELYDRGIAGGRVRATLMPDVTVTSARLGGEGVELGCRHGEQDRAFTVRTDRVVLATGYAPRRPAMLDPLADLIARDDAGRWSIDVDHRVRLAAHVTGGLYTQNAELHTHGVGTPDLGLGAHRAATILNSVCGSAVYRLPIRTAFTTFGLAAGDTEPPPRTSRRTATDPAEVVNVAVEPGSGAHRGRTAAPGRSRRRA
jgi:putrescine N-hydroxylase